MDLEREVEYQNEKKAAMRDMSSETEIILSKPTSPLKGMKTKNKIVKDTTTKPDLYKCNQCNFKGKNKVTLNKHMNTKHGDSEKKENVNELNCIFCEKKFVYKNYLEEHISEHLEEIKEINIESLKSGHDIYECTMCSFESGHNDSIKEHLIKHVLSPKSTEKKDNNKKDDI